MGVNKKLIEPPNEKAEAPLALKACVPDAPNTGEHWATKPVTAKKIMVIRHKNNGEYEVIKKISDTTD